MRISTVGYSMKQGVKNIGRNKMFSIASIATMAACIFLFGLFYSIVLNFNYIVEKAEESVAITVFFDENATQAQKDEIGDTLADADGVLSVTYVSADEAWESFSETYFGGSEEAAEGFANDNPLATSDNYEVYLSDVSKQDDVVALAKSLPGVRPDDGDYISLDYLLREPFPSRLVRVDFDIPEIEAFKRVHIKGLQPVVFLVFHVLCSVRFETI